ncbi:MAG TPA: hypothetical protein VG917_01610 [Patescibacteria group bacterium]|nr:hypothetical protein [Patescibacteria group bacterium]
MLERYRGQEDRLTAESLGIKPVAFVFGRDEDRVNSLSVGLLSQGVVAVPSVDPEEVKRLMFDLRPHALILDEVSYRQYAIDWIKQKRIIPPLFIYSEHPIQDIELSNDTGVESTIVSPDNYIEISDKVKDILARGLSGVNPVVKMGSVEIDLRSRILKTPTGDINLSSEKERQKFGREWPIFALLAINAGREMSGEELKIKTMGQGHSKGEFRQHMSKLRKRLGRYSDVILKPYGQSVSEFMIKLDDSSKGVEKVKTNNEKFKPDDLPIAPLVVVVGSRKYVDYFSKGLKNEGIGVIPAWDIKEAELAMLDIRPDAVILDEWTYWEDGLRMVREGGKIPPLLVSTSKQVKGVNIFGRKGIDAVISESGHSATASKLKRDLSRRLSRVNSVLKLGPIEVDLNNHTVGSSGQTIAFLRAEEINTFLNENRKAVSFNSKQWAILSYLVVNSGRAVSRRELMLRLLGESSPRSFASDVRDLKNKLGIYSDIISETPDGKYTLSAPK